jgi:3-deoxy-D-manno-octulosonic-acid transferase
MYLFYSIALFLVLVLATPYLLYQAIVYKKYLANFSQRLGLKPLDFASIKEPKILIHCVSVGEFLAAEPLIEALRKNLPNYKIVISTTTLTGQKLALERASKFALVCYFPLDFPFSVKKFLAQINPKAIVIMETEIWPNFFRFAKNQNIPIFIANGRISDRSFRRYKLFKTPLTKVLSLVTKFMMQSAQDAERILALGAPKDSVVVCGNIKYDFGTAEQTARLDKLALELSEKLYLKQSTPLLVAGSTTPGEEEIIVTAYKNLIANNNLSKLRLLIAPRRPERFDEVATLLANNKIEFIRRSKLLSDNANSLGELLNKQVILLDSIGELAAIYRYADVVFVGGSLVPYGGHNILEPALYSKAIITGPYMNNFHKIIADFLSAQAVVQLPVLEKEALVLELSNKLADLFHNETKRQELGLQAYKVIEANRGALAKHIDLIVRGIK